ncbi:MAG: precorrin-8X methylmutase, partial [Lachnoanaerobaculum sp.]|nr:precorrin-8X methylmutase [Lachnoanaerobaculum sp.]
MLEVRPEDIEKKSFEILTSRMDENRLKFYSEDELLVVKRTIHTTADFDYQNNVIFQNNALKTIKDCIQSGAMIFTDTNMALSGINKRILTGKFGIEPLCLIADDKIIE